MMCTPDGAGCALAGPGAGFASVADALRVGRALGTYLNSPAVGGLDGPARGRPWRPSGRSRPCSARPPMGAREIAAWTGRIDHEELQGEADRILVEAAAAGADLDGLKLIAQAAYEAWRAQEPDPDDDPRGRKFGDRYLRLETTLDGAGRISGDLTPESAPGPASTAT